MKRSLLIALAACSAMGASGVRNAPALMFLPNQGQAPSEVRFLVRGSRATGFFLPGEAVFRVGRDTLRIHFDGAEAGGSIEGAGLSSGKANIFIGAEEGWHADVPLYSGITYRGLYSGIDLIYGASGWNLKSEFVVAAGADPSRIRMRYEGAGTLSLAEDGALIIPVGDSELREEAPRIYQLRGGRPVRVAGAFRVVGDTVEFEVGDYDRNAPLVIDPVLYNTLLGGGSSDAATALAVDASGSAYVAGFTASYDFPTANPEQNFNAGSNDVFVAKLNAAGNGVVYCTYLGGTGDDRAYGIALGADGSAYVTGVTASKNFPLAGALQSKLAGAKNAFVFKLGPAGNVLNFSTYLGGSGSDTANAIALDSSGNVYLAGDTTSANFPATGFQTGKKGGQDAFVAKLAGDGSRVVYATYLGGTYDDHASAIAVDASGSAYVTGSTISTDFPVSQAYQASNAGGQDAFVTRLSGDGGSLLFSTYLGGSGGQLGYPESGQGIALDSSGNAYVAGVTASSDFPLLHPAQSSLRGWLDAFAVKLTSSGTLAYSTYLGGTGVDTANAVAVDSSGAAYIAGQTYSTDLPVVNAFQPVSGGGYDAFVAKLASTGDSVLLLSYLGGGGSDTATSIALDSSANIYVAGWTLSTNFPVVNGYQSVNAGTYGAFAAKIGSGASASPPSVSGVSPSSGSGSSQTFAFRFSDPQGAADLSSVSVLINSSTATTSACAVTYNPAANTLALLTDAGAAPSTTIAPGSGSQQNSQCTLSGTGSSVSKSGNVLTLNLALTFQTAFAGSWNIYAQATNPYGSTGWVQSGSWTVPAPSGPTPVSVTPSSGKRHQPDVCVPLQRFRRVRRPQYGVDGDQHQHQRDLELLFVLCSGEQLPLPGQRCGDSLAFAVDPRAKRNVAKQPVRGRCLELLFFGQRQQPDDQPGDYVLRRLQRLQKHLHAGLRWPELRLAAEGHLHRQRVGQPVRSGVGDARLRDRRHPDVRVRFLRPEGRVVDLFRLHDHRDQCGRGIELLPVFHALVEHHLSRQRRRHRVADAGGAGHQRHGEQQPVLGQCVVLVLIHQRHQPHRERFVDVPPRLQRLEEHLHAALRRAEFGLGAERHLDREFHHRNPCPGVGLARVRQRRQPDFCVSLFRSQGRRFRLLGLHRDRAERFGCSKLLPVLSAFVQQPLSGQRCRHSLAFAGSVGSCYNSAK